jgi:Flp pilus assembly protein TadG
VKSSRNLVAELVKRARRALRDRRGVSVIEFAFLAPMLILTYVGAVEIANALTIYRRTGAVASTAADLAAQVKEVTIGDINDILNASSTLLTPYSVTPLKVVLSSVVADDENETKVAWSCANKGAGRARNSAYAVPAGLTQADSSVIMAEVTYSFQPLLNLTRIFSPGAFDMKRTFYARPRKSLTVKKTDGGGC